MKTQASTKVISAIAAVLASCVTLGSVIVLFDSANDRSSQTAAAVQTHRST